ncbi:MAG: GumC family protein [Pseudomonadota bacterium]
MTRPVQERRITWSKDNAHPLAGFKDEPRLDVGALTRAVRRQAALVMICATAGIVIAVLMILGSIPRYTAVETVLLDEERAELLNNVSPLPNAVRSDTAVQSEIEIIRSRALAYEVVDLLRLDQDEDFLSPPIGATQAVMNTISSLADPLADLLTRPPPAPVSDSTETGASETSEIAEAPPVDFDLDVTDRDRAVGILRDRLTVRRSGRSLVIEMGFTDFNPTRAAQIARGYGTAYENFQLTTTNEVAGKAEQWLRDRLVVLEQKSIEASTALQEFRAENDLVQVRGNLLTEQQQSELASELMTAAADAAEAEAQLESMESLLARARDSDEVIIVPMLDSQASSALEELRRDYLDTRLRYRRLITQFGEDHPQAAQLRNRVETLREAIQIELEQATQAARVAYTTSRSREQSLRRDLQATTDTTEGNVALRGQLEQLQAISETYAQVYRDYLARLEVTMQQQNFPIAAVKIISRAEVPKGASSPQKKSMLFTGMMLGAFLGMIIGGARELIPKPVRTMATLRDDVGLNCAGLLPPRKAAKDGSVERTTRRTLERLAQACEASLDNTGTGRLIAIAPLTDGVEDARALPLALAQRLARQGTRKILLVEENLPNGKPPVKTHPGVEIVDLSTVLGSYASAKGAAYGTDLGQLADDLRDKFSIVLVSMAPITKALQSDPNAWAYDMTLLRIPWGKILPGFITDALMDHPHFRERLSTTVLEDADLKIARRYMSPGSYEERESHA